MTIETSSDDDDFIIPTISMPEFDATEQLIANTINRHNMLITRYFNQQNIERPRGGSISGRAVINRDREAADRILFADYFVDNHQYNDGMFRRRFQMSRNIFIRIVDAIKQHDNYFAQQSDRLSRL